MFHPCLATNKGCHSFKTNTSNWTANGFAHNVPARARETETSVLLVYRPSLPHHLKDENNAWSLRPIGGKTFSL